MYLYINKLISEPSETLLMAYCFPESLSYKSLSLWKEEIKMKCINHTIKNINGCSLKT